MRMRCRCLTRFTTGYSKHLENFKAVIGLYFGYCNLVKIHSTLRTTPAMAAEVMPDLWTVADWLGKLMAETLDYIQTLHEAIRKGHGCQFKHVTSVPVEEKFQRRTVWKGTAEVFDLIGHSTAKPACAWGHAARNTGNEVRMVTIPSVPPVDSPRKAVHASILRETGKGRN